MKTLMVAVAVVALAFPISRMAIFYYRHYNSALTHAGSEKYYALELKNLNFTEFDPSVSSERRQKLMAQWVARARDRMRYHAEMKLKYERAATHPWDHVEPDPPEPG